MEVNKLANKKNICSRPTDVRKNDNIGVVVSNLLSAILRFHGEL